VTGLTPILQVQEAATGAGYLCGGAFVNRVFARYMKETFGDNRAWSDQVLAEAVEEFEQKIKRKFTGKNDKSYSMNVGIQRDPRGIKGSKLRLSGAKVKEFFDPVVSEICKLVKAQISTTRKEVKWVVLVGGFGANQYLYDRLQREVGTTIKVKKSKNPYVRLRSACSNKTSLTIAK
jgi:hypothetical protein